MMLLVSQLCLAQNHLLDEGVSWELAQYRKESISNLRYALSFSIPESKDEDIEGEAILFFDLNEKKDIVLDFRESKDKVHSVCIDKSNDRYGKQNFKKCNWQFVNDHIIIPQKYVKAGFNKIKITFTAGNQSINRRDGYVYTLFVPDRARTAFPCFDQPNMKALFNLALEIPKSWNAVHNGYKMIVIDDSSLKKRTKKPARNPEYKKLHFEINTPIPTYLFAFAAGEFKYQKYQEDGISIGAYYRESDSARIAQLPEIMHQVVFSMKWQEDFTGVKYPYPKYDLVILPGFQFGGMEHAGATFYNDNTIFLSANPTPDERLRRTELIAHETSHMWFGDAVTMNWFDDVWTKEVFANYFAAEITEPLFPDLNHSLNWLKTYVNAAISQDRTEGRTSIRQPLDNLKYAGLVYNNIIYNKAPVMMRKMVELMGKEAFRRGIQKYVQKYLHSNATWDDLITILDAETDADLKSFSKEWVEEAHWPHHTAKTYLEGSDGKTYGYIELNANQIDSLMAYLPSETDGTARQALLMNLNENYLNGKIEAAKWLTFLRQMMLGNWDQLTYMSLIRYMNEPLAELKDEQARESEEAEIWQFTNHPNTSVRTQIIRLLASKATSPAIVDCLYNVWKDNKNPFLSINDYMTLSYELAIRMPEQAESIISTQRSRITNADRLAQYDYVSRALSPSTEARDELFASLSKAENRRIEPWTLSVLYYLNHPLRQKEAVKYITPALELLPDIQQTGDIFFPGNWCSDLLAGHRSAEALREVETFLDNHKDYQPMLRSKILEAKYYLERVNKNDKQ